jgi:hypothetical protein
LGREGRKRFFFEKKKQKTFAYCGRWRGRGQGRRSKSFFGSFFSKKEPLSYFFEICLDPPESYANLSAVQQARAVPNFGG